MEPPPREARPGNVAVSGAALFSNYRRPPRLAIRGSKPCSIDFRAAAMVRLRDPAWLPISEEICIAARLPGAAYGLGTIFELERPSSPGGTWTHNVLHSFKGVPSGKGNGDGALPSGVRFDAVGNLYGTTDQGGFCTTSDGITVCYGSVFRLTPPGHLGGTWTESVLYRFGVTGLSDPHGGVILDAQGNLYGTTYIGERPFMTSAVSSNCRRLPPAVLRGQRPRCLNSFLPMGAHPMAR